ncbi:unnamed protein product [Musa textilis]
MSSTVLEVARPAHEDVERPIVRELQREPVNNRDSLFRSHRVCHMIHLITSTTDALIGVYEEDKDNARRDDIAARSIFSVRFMIVTRSWEFFESLELGKKVVDSRRILVSFLFRKCSWNHG